MELELGLTIGRTMLVVDLVDRAIVVDVDDVGVSCKLL